MLSQELPCLKMTAAGNCLDVTYLQHMLCTRGGVESMWSGSGAVSVTEVKAMEKWLVG